MTPRGPNPAPRLSGVAALLGVSLALAAGCGGDIGTMIASKPEIRDKVIRVFMERRDLAAQMVDSLLAADSTRDVVVDRVFGNGVAVESVLGRVAKERTMVDGVLTLAVQDTSMKTHLLTLLKGMEMGAAPAPAAAPSPAP